MYNIQIFSLRKCKDNSKYIMWHGGQVIKALNNRSENCEIFNEMQKFPLSNYLKKKERKKEK